MFTRALTSVATTVALTASLLVVAQPAAAATVSASQLPQLLRVQSETTSPAYSRAAFEHWIDDDRDGCNTRYEVLIEESTTAVSVTGGCALSGGTWVSPYDGVVAYSPAEVEIDHVVALAEAWRSGAWAWTAEQREDFANDIGVPYALTAASTASNQSKADKDPARWLPTNGSYVCEYVTSWALTKYRWSLTVDAAEQTALQNVLQGDCGATQVQLPQVMVTAGETAPGPGTDPAPITFPAGASRLAGQSRYTTAIEVSKKYAPGVAAVFVATGTNFPDALSAAAAASALGGPLLLTPPTVLNPAVRNEIARLQPKQIFVTGSTGAVSEGVRRALQAIAPVERLGGASRYETGNAIVKRAFTSSEHAFIATGRTFPDALAATGAAGSLSAPVILVDGVLRSLTPATLSLLKSLGVKSVTVVGSTGAVSAGIEAQLRGSYTTTRIGGSDRYATAANINNEFFAQGSAPAAFVATGADFPDALAGAALAGRVGGAVYITRAACVPEAAHLSLKNLAAPSTIALGGTSVVSSNALANGKCVVVPKPPVVKPPVTTYPDRTKPVAGSWDCPSWARIKGNASSMIYHVPGGASYSKTKPEECFKTEAAAKAAGYRKAKR